MDFPSLPPNFFDLLADAASAAEAKRRADSTFVPLVEGDGLFFRVLSPARMEPFQTRAAAVADAFRRAFSGIWERLPEADRQCLITFWQRPSLRVHSSDYPHDRYKPIIQVVDLGSRSSAYTTFEERGGHVLNFPADLVAGQPQRLPFTIARALAQVLRWATPDYWRLFMATVEEPMDKWEQRRMGTATEAESDQQLNLLEQEFLRRHEEELVRILCRWEFKEAPAQEAMTAG